MRRKSWRLGAETIMSNNHTARSGTTSRPRSLNRYTQPARVADQGRKTLAPAEGALGSGPTKLRTLPQAGGEEGLRSQTELSQRGNAKMISFHSVYLHEAYWSIIHDKVRYCRKALIQDHFELTVLQYYSTSDPNPRAYMRSISFVQIVQTSSPCHNPH